MTVDRCGSGGAGPRADPRPTSPAPPEAHRIAERRRAFDAVPPELYPRTARTAATMAAYVGTGQFTWGLDRLLDGLGLR